MRRVGTLPSKFEMQHKTDIYFHLILLGFVAEEQEGRGDFDLKDKIRSVTMYKLNIGKLLNIGKY